MPKSNLFKYWLKKTSEEKKLKEVVQPILTGGLRGGTGLRGKPFFSPPSTRSLFNLEHYKEKAQINKIEANKKVLDKIKDKTNDFATTLNKPKKNQ